MLKKGTVYKNYKDMCNQLGMKITTGHNKQLQLKALSVKCLWHKEGNKIIIDEVYDSKQIVKEKRVGNNSKYIEPLEMLIMCELMCNNGVFESTYNKLIEKLSLLTDNFSTFQTPDMIKKVNLDKLTFYAFKKEVNTNFKNKINSTINSMASRKLIAKEERLFSVFISGEERIASEEEIQAHINACKMALEKLQSTSIKEIRTKNMQFRYYDLVSKFLNELGYSELKTVVTGFKIVSTNRNIFSYFKNQYRVFSLLKLHLLSLDTISKKGIYITRRTKKAREKLINQIIDDKIKTFGCNEFGSPFMGVDEIKSFFYDVAESIAKDVIQDINLGDWNFLVDEMLAPSEEEFLKCKEILTKKSSYELDELLSRIKLEKKDIL